MKCQICVDIESGLVHTVKGVGGELNELIEALGLVRSTDREVLAYAGWQGADKRPDARVEVTWHIASRSFLRKTLDPSDAKCWRSRSHRASPMAPSISARRMACRLSTIRHPHDAMPRRVT